MKILIVDDSAYTRKRISAILKEAGYETLEAGGGKQALEIFKEQDPAIVTVDLLMPEMDGITLIKNLRRLNAYTKIVALSADIQELTQKEVFSAGASAFVAKTEKPAQILATIRALYEKEPAIPLSPEQKDAFSEMLNIAIGQAAKALASLLNRRVKLMVPEIRIMRVNDLVMFLRSESPLIGTAVQQVFSGKINGQAYLIFPKNQAEIMIRALLDAGKELFELSFAEQAILMEVGNIVLNSSIAQLGNQLQTRLKISMPTLTLDIASEGLSDMIFKAFFNRNHAIVLVSDLTVGELTMRCFIALVLQEKGIGEILVSMGV